MKGWYVRSEDGWQGSSRKTRGRNSLLSIGSGRSNPDSTLDLIRRRQVRHLRVSNAGAIFVAKFCLGKLS